MYPIAIVFVVGLAIAIERYVYLTAAAARNRGLWNEIVPLLAQGNFRGVAGDRQVRLRHRPHSQLRPGAHSVGTPSR
jgi:hypothetical protein